MGRHRRVHRAVDQLAAFQAFERRGQDLGRHALQAPLDGADGPPARDERAAPGPATQVEQRIDVAAMLDSLPPDYREVIGLREWQQMSYAEMAAALGDPERTAETRLTRARRMLRQRFGGYG